MADAKDTGKLIAKVAATVVTICSNKKFQESIFGTYSDGTRRNFFDAWNGEVLSPKQRRKKLYKKKKSGKKKIRL